MIKKLIVVILIILVIVFIVFSYKSDEKIFKPTRDIVWRPSEPYIDEMIEDVYGNRTLNIWYFNREKQNTIIFYHGNTGNISNRRYIVEISSILECNLLLVDYRGYGKSKESPSKAGICSDGIAFYDYLVKTIGTNPSNIIIWGESLGGSVAIYVASKRECKGLIVISAFSSLDDIIRDRYPGALMNCLSNLVERIWYTIPSKKMISKVNCPVCIVHSENDTYIPYKSATRIYNNANEPKRLVTIHGEHDCPSITSSQIRELMEFCDLKPNKEECERVRNIISEISF